MHTNIKTSATHPPTPRRFLRRLRTRNAMALVGTMMVLMLILAATLIGFAGMAGKSSGDLGSTSSNMLQMTRKRNNVQQAETMADAGLRAAIQWISDQPSPPTKVNAFTPREVTTSGFYPGSSPTDADKWTSVNFVDANGQQGTFKVRFYPHANNATADRRGFLVESIGTFGGETRVVRADIRQKNFAQYAYFTDTLSEQHFIAGLTTFNGPVHINNSTNKDMPVVWDSGAILKPLPGGGEAALTENVARLFQWDGDNSFTMWQGEKVGNGYANDNKVLWKKDVTSSTRTPPVAGNADQWKRVIAPVTDANGNYVKHREGPVMTAEKVEMPTTSDELRNAALGGKSAPTEDGVYVPTSGGIAQDSGVPSGGIYIKGQVDDMVLEAKGTNNTDQVIYVYQGGGDAPSTVKWKVTLVAGSTGTTTVEKFTRDAQTSLFKTEPDIRRTYAGGKTNGVVYSYDNIGKLGAQKGGLSGTVANTNVGDGGLNKMTIATRVEGAATDKDSETNTHKTINIDGNILYANTKKHATQAPENSGLLGIVAGYVRVVNKARVEESSVTGFANYTASLDIDPPPASQKTHKIVYANDADLTNLSVHSTIMAFNTASVDNWNTRNESIAATETTPAVVKPEGEFHMLGGYIAKDPSRFGNVNPDTLAVTTGFKRILNYDRRVANQPPPHFPGTGQAYEALSYQRVLTPLQP